MVGAPSGDGEQRRAAGSELPPTPPRKHLPRWERLTASPPRPRAGRMLLTHAPNTRPSPKSSGGREPCLTSRPKTHIGALVLGAAPLGLWHTGPSQTRPCRRLPAHRDRRGHSPRLPPPRRVRVATPTGFPPNRVRRTSLQVTFPQRQVTEPPAKSHATPATRRHGRVVSR